ncbi:TolC family protein [Geobacter sp. DSM 9736]|uniref:TolC family protein n=1 Tax=Geobacter sp. DSM 9736 TaxID=1277350 RepID=UPI000B502170|nr:TolC family protein [Geobacter sp. DSM 9736]SNB45852.1 Outer membrane protein TolC [Geobacter sp. DSM 9736]
MRVLILTIVACVCIAGAGSAGELTLEQCLRKAAAMNRTLKLAAIDHEAAAEGVRIARSGYLPRIDLQGGYTAQLEPQSIKFGSGSFPTQDQTYPFFNLGINQILYDFGRTGARVRRAALVADAAALELSGRKQDIFLQVTEAYFAVLEQSRVLLALEEEVTQRREHSRVAQNLFEQGVVTRNDLLQAEVRLADSTQRKLDAANRVETAWLKLNFLMCEEPGFRGELQELPEIGEVDLEEATAERALSARPDIAALKRVAQAGEAEVTEARTAFFPEVYARAGIDYVQNSRSQEQAIYSATLGLRVNLFEGFAATARQQQAVLGRSHSNEILRAEEERIRIDLEIAKNEVRVTAQRVRTLEQSIRQGEENLRINRDRYTEQVGTATEVLDSQTLLTQVRTEYIRAKYAHQLALARVKHALGQLAGPPSLREIRSP